MAREAVTDVADIVRYLSNIQVAEAMIDDLVLQIMDLPPPHRVELVPILARLRTDVEALRLTIARVIVARYGSE